MKLLETIDVSVAHEQQYQKKLSIYALLVENRGESFLVGCGLWDRERELHTSAVKDKTPGLVVRVNSVGVITDISPELENIVYPTVASPWGGVFVGCRTGAMYLLDPTRDGLPVKPLGYGNGGIYGVAYAVHHDWMLLGMRDGTLVAYDRKWNSVWTLSVSDDRLWNLCVDPDGEHVWASSYNRRLYRIHVGEQRVVEVRDLESGAVTFVASLSDGSLAIGCMGRCIHLFRGDAVQRISVASPVCYISDVPRLQRFLATGYKGEVWSFAYNGTLIDTFALDSRENNPIWIGQQCGLDTQVAFAWANGVIRILDVS